MAKDKLSSKAKPPMTTVHLARDVWHLLRRVALARALKQGGRVSLGDVVVGLVERSRRDLEREIG